MISIIIPAYNEEECLGENISSLLSDARKVTAVEVIVSDGGSTDRTVELAEQAGATVVISPKKGRSAQMNFGASFAKGKILYFLHADTRAPAGFSKDILHAFCKGHTSGCFMLQFDHSHWFLRLNCWFTRFDFNYFRFGDQSLFVSRGLFEKSGGFREDHIVMEDQEIIKRIRKLSAFTIIKKPVLTSARKYLENGIYKTQGIFFLIFLMYQIGFSQQTLVRTYRRLIRQDKV
ncbi:TIGR04283 family arsenosugar biosynthesis glycosyltransferase [Desertivirga brevis]|uniref:TIGR04283 family arsenosugar biosynthesis glycosyltransferase n=1 Tax=Desertivirga brevis TaxID=2810310 RepID=UPI001A977A71|nr:TIGR04283 family arsenosugar biosynthesis glycosyltransferase [Pedobacter sp. SYSU D00873]